ncbi:MAG: tyrosine-type recombinase/integrase [Candidatus Odinarchaeota archaeon]
MNRPTNNKLIKDYLNYFQHSPQSQAMRKSSLKYFFSKEHFNYNGHIFEITTKKLKEYFTWLKNLEDLSIETKKGKWNILSSFLNSTMEDYPEEFLVKIPGKTVNWIGSNGNKSKEKEIFTKNELEQILNYIKPRNLKNYLIFRLFAETGMRKGELINIEYPNVNTEKRTITTIGKRGEKVYYFSKDLSRFLEIYLNNRKNISIKDKTLFLTNRFTKYSNRAFNLYLKKVCNSLGIEKTITCHTFRRSLNQHRYDINCSNEDRKILLNHSVRDVNVENYLIIDYKRFIALYDQYNPYKELNL